HGDVVAGGERRRDSTQQRAQRDDAPPIAGTRLPEANEPELLCEALQCAGAGEPVIHRRPLPVPALRIDQAECELAVHRNDVTYQLNLTGYKKRTRVAPWFRGPGISARCVRPRKPRSCVEPFAATAARLPRWSSRTSGSRIARRT